MNQRQLVMVSIAALAAPILPVAAQTSSVFKTAPSQIAGSSDTADATVTFSLTGTTLTITLTNKGLTSSNGSILDGLFFNTNTSAAVNLLPTVTASQSWNGSAVSANADFTGGWQMKSVVAPPGQSIYSYGLSAVGANVFSSSSFTKGNGGDDYGLMGSATCPNGNCATSANKPPLGVGSLVFMVTNFTGTLINSVAVVYNSALSSLVGTSLSSGSGNLYAVAVPEPASIGILGIGLACLQLFRRRRR